MFLLLQIPSQVIKLSKISEKGTYNLIGKKTGRTQIFAV